MNEKQSKTWLCSVVFLDIARYTQNPVARQLELKEQLEGYIDVAVTNVAESDRIIVDTGDGAALCFLGDPEEALIAALCVRDTLLSTDNEDGAGLQVRIGINLGPIKVIKSLNGQLNPLGDGINKAQRVMGFANINQILVSRSFYDVIACLSEEYSRLFHYLGMRKDKHECEHPIYEVVVPGQPNTETRNLLTRATDKESSIEIAMSTGWDPVVLESVSAELAAYIGPLARVLVKKAIKKATSMEELHRLLADSIPREESKRTFLERASHSVPLQRGRTPVSGSTRGLAPESSLAMSADAAVATPTHPDPSVLARIEAHLAQYVGPLARLLVKQISKETTDIQELCHRLAQEIASSEHRRQFLSSVAKLSDEG